MTYADDIRRLAGHARRDRVTKPVTLRVIARRAPQFDPAEVEAAAAAHHRATGHGIQGGVWGAFCLRCPWEMLPDLERRIAA